MAAGFAWVLNLDADLELAVPAYTPKTSVRVAMRALVPRVAANLLDPHDVLLDETSDPGSARGLVGRAFCPTPRALAILERAGAIPERHPTLEVLRRVNSRAFCASLGQTLPEAELVTDEAAALAKIARGGPWRVKRLFGMSGKNQRVVGTAAEEIDHGFVRTGIAEGGVQIEPNVTIEEEHAVHAMLAEDGALAIAGVVTQRCDARGAWLGAVPFTGPADVRERLEAEAARVARALSASGYFGPFGIDAFTYDGGRLNPRSEINARYTMSFRRTTTR
jgi:phosphoribosylaminoimidazole carboxylase (NCAIR synthetase)